MLQHYGGNNLPEKPFLTNTLQQTFGLDPEVHDEFVDVFAKNCRFLGIGDQFVALGVDGRATTSVGGIPVPDTGSITVATPEDGGGDTFTLFVIMPFTERDDRHETGFSKRYSMSLLERRQGSPLGRQSVKAAT